MMPKTRLGEGFGHTIAIALPLVAILLAAILTLPLACGKKEAEEIKIGIIAPLTGENATYGLALKRGMDLAFETINNSGGVSGKRLAPVFEDSQAEPQKGVSSFRKLVSVDNVSIVLGGMFSAVTLAIAPIAEEKGVVLLSPTSSAVEITDAGDYIFRIYPSDSYDGEFLANFAIDKLGAKTVSVLYIQVASVTAITEVFKEVFEAKGGKILDLQGYSEGNTDFKTQLQKIKNTKPDVIFLAGYLREMAIQLKQTKELGIKQPVISISTFYDDKIFSLAGEAAEGVLFSTPYYDVAAQDSVTTEFVRKFEARFDEPPNIWAGYGYDVARVAGFAMERALERGQLTAQGIKQQLYRIKDFPGVTGRTTFDENGDVLKELKILKAENGAFVDF